MWTKPRIKKEEAWKKQGLPFESSGVAHPPVSDQKNT